MDRIVIVTKPTRLDELILQYHNEGTVRFILESCGEAIDSYKLEDEKYKSSLEIVRRQIPSDIPTVTVSREDLPDFLFRSNDLIIVCGPDGLFANLAKYVGDQMVLAVNPDPENITGQLMLFSPQQVGAVIKDAVKNKVAIQKIPFVKASVDNRTVWGINDVFIGRNDQISARYKIDFCNESENQSSSGIIVSTGIGSTGWISSISEMLIGLSNNRDHSRLCSKLRNLPKPTDTELVFVVREAFPSVNTGAKISFGRITPNEPLIVTSQMPKGGCIFSDGVTEKAISWNAGQKIIVTVGDRYLNRIIP